MSDTAVSSQIVSEMNTSQTAAASTTSVNNSAVKTQASEFDSVLENKLESLEDVNSEEQLIALLNPLSNTLPLSDVDGKFSVSQTQQTLDSLATTGKTLPTQLPAQLSTQLSGNNGLMKSTNPLLLQNASVEDNIDSNTLLPTLLNGKNSSGEIQVEEGVLTKQLNANLNTENKVDLKPLSTQLFSQFLNQTQSKTKLLPVSESGVASIVPTNLTVNQNFSMQSSQATLPPITVPPENAQWNSQVGDRINWMVNNNMQRVEIRLDPPELGNLDIRLNIAKDNQASIMVHVTNATAKEAIESAIPRLREMFEQQGLDLGDVDVSQQNHQQQSQFEQSEQDILDDNAFNSFGTNDAEQDDDGILATTNLNSSSNNLLDIFA